MFVPHLSPVAVVLSANNTCVSRPTGSLAFVELNVYKSPFVVRGDDPVEVNVPAERFNPDPMVISSIIPVPAVLLPTSLLVFIEVVIVPDVVIDPPEINPVVPTEVTEPVPYVGVKYSTAVSPILTLASFKELPVRESKGANLLFKDNVPVEVIVPPVNPVPVPTEVTVPADAVAYSTAVSPALTRKTFNEFPVKESIGASLLSSDIVPVVVIGPPVKPVPVATFVTVPPAASVLYYKDVSVELTLNTWYAVPNVDKPVPPLV